MSYTPQPGTIPARVIAYLHEQARVGRAWVPSAEVSEHVGQPAVSPYMEAALNHGAVRKRAVAQNKRLSEYSLGDGTPLPAPADMEADKPLRVEPITPKAGPLFPTVAKSTKPEPRIFRAGLFTDGTLVVEICEGTFTLNAQQAGELARLFRMQMGGSA